MSLAGWDPFADMDSLFDRFLPSLRSPHPRLASPDDGGAPLEWSPKADISETEKEYLVRAELPAVKAQDVKVTLDDGILAIEGERKPPGADESEKPHRVERYFGRFARRFALPENLDINNIKCESQDGILTVHLPKASIAKPKAVEIKVQ